METGEQLAILKTLPVLGRVPEENREQIVRIIQDLADIDDYAEGESLMHEGHLAFETGYVVLKGTVEVKREGLESVTLSAPVLLGEMSQFIDGDRRTATVHAKGDVTALNFPWDEFHEQIKEQLSDRVHRSFIDALERVVWERFDLKDILDLALFKDLDENLRLDVCLPFPWITERRLIADGDILFKQGDRCQAQGFLITHGTISLTRSEGGEKSVKAPDIIGVIPAPKPDMKWSATAQAKGDVEVLRFSWELYIDKLNERLTKEEKTVLIQSMKAHSSKHFRY